MITKKQYQEAQKKALEYFSEAGIVLTEVEKENIEVADFGLNELESTGLELITYVNTSRCCAKELILFPIRHVQSIDTHQLTGSREKKKLLGAEVVRSTLYVEGEPTENPRAKAPKGREKSYTVWHEVALSPGQQYTLYPNTKHWFQAGKDGAVVSEFSTKSRDEADIFTDEEIQRMSKIKE